MLFRCVNVVLLLDGLPFRSAEAKVSLPFDDPMTKFCSRVKLLLAAVTLSALSIVMAARNRSSVALVVTAPVEAGSEPVCRFRCNESPATVNASVGARLRRGSPAKTPKAKHGYLNLLGTPRSPRTARQTARRGIRKDW